MRGSGQQSARLWSVLTGMGMIGNSGLVKAALPDRCALVGQPHLIRQILENCPQLPVPVRSVRSPLSYLNNRL